MTPGPEDYAAAAETMLRYELELAAHHLHQAQTEQADGMAGLLELGAHLRVARDAADRALACWATLATRDGASWRQIGDAVGISRQAAQQRWGHMLAAQPPSATSGAV